MASSSSSDCETYVQFLLITANVGSIFENPEELFASWIAELVKCVSKHRPLFFVLHCQEMGGKNSAKGMKHAVSFLESICAGIPQYSTFLAIFDEDIECLNTFTALASFYFIHDSLKQVELYNYKDNSFNPFSVSQIYRSNLDDVPILRREKFPLDFSPNGRPFRKGFMRTKWRIGSESTFDFVNLHLFHDESNLISLQEYPSKYSLCRRKALSFVVKRLEEESEEGAPFFIFGDFNVRLDFAGVVKDITHEGTPIMTKSPSDLEFTEVSYKDKDEQQTLLHIEKKVFDVQRSDLLSVFTKNFDRVRKYDLELQHFIEKLHEYKIKFPPSYPYEESAEKTGFMRTRCPAWCDRILLSKAAKEYCRDGSVTYDLIGKSVCMGDHKPVALALEVAVVGDLGVGSKRTTCCSCQIL